MANVENIIQQLEVQKTQSVENTHKNDASGVLALYLFGNGLSKEMKKLLEQIMDGDSVPTSTLVPAEEEKKAKQPLLDMKAATNPYGPTPSGMWQVMAAVLANVEAIENYESQGTELAAATSQLNLTITNGWFAVLDKDVGTINDIMNKVQDPKKYGKPPKNWQSLITVDSTNFNLDNTKASQSQTNFGNITDGVNQNNTSAAQTFATVLDLYQKGPQAQLQIIAQVV